jgi:hypothetical protein
MTRSYLTILFTVLFISACGGGGESEDKPTQQPWLGGVTGGDNSGGTSSDVPTNSPPNLSGVPAGNVSIPFGVEGTFLIGTSDPEGDVLTLSLLNAPDWMILDSTGRVTFTPNAVGDFESIYVQVSDGVNVVNSDTFSLNVTPPAEITFQIPGGNGLSSNDVFSLRVFNGTETVTAFVSEFVEDEGVFFTLPYPIPESLKSSTVLMTWSKTSFVDYNKLIGPIDTIYQGLNEAFEMSEESLSALTPTATSSAYFHMLSKFEDETLSLDFMDSTVLFRLNNSVRAGSFEQLSAYYHLARTAADLQSINTLLTEDIGLFSVRAGLSPSFYEAIITIRQEDSSLVNNRFWLDLMGSATDALPTYDFDWSGRVQLVPTINLGYSPDTGVIINLVENDRYFAKDEKDYLSLEPEGLFRLESEAVYIPLKNDGDDDVPVSMPFSSDVIVLSERIESYFSLDASLAFEWASALVDLSAVDSIDFLRSPGQELKISTVFVASNGDAFMNMDVLGQVSLSPSFSDAYGVELSSQYSRYEGSSVARKLPVNEDKAKVMRFRPEIFDIIVDMPYTTVTGGIEYKKTWLDLYDMPLVREKDIDNEELFVSDWTSEYTEEGVLVFHHPDIAGALATYSLNLTAAAAQDGTRTGSIDVHRYTVSSTLTQSAVVVGERVLPVVFSARTLCEVSGCLVESVKKEGLLWFDANNGTYFSDNAALSDDIFLFISEKTADVDGETVVVSPERFAPVTTTNDCQGEVEVCWALSGDYFNIVGDSYSNLWITGLAGSIRFPIDVRNNGFSWMRGDSVQHYESADREMDGLYWTCSFIDPERGVDGEVIANPLCGAEQ